MSTPHPFHDGPCVGSDIGGLLGHRFGMLRASPIFALPIGRPLMNSATRRFSMSDNPVACVCIAPVVRASRIRSGVISRMAAAEGALLTEGLLWQTEQRV